MLVIVIKSTAAGKLKHLLRSLNLLIIGTWATWNAAGVISQIDGYAFYEYDWYNEQDTGAHHACASFGIIVVSARFFDRFFLFRHLPLAAHQELVE